MKPVLYKGKSNSGLAIVFFCEKCERINLFDINASAPGLKIYCTFCGTRRATNADEIAQVVSQLADLESPWPEETAALTPQEPPDQRPARWPSARS